MVSLEDIAAFVAGRLGVRREVLSAGTRLVQDLGVDGDDFVELMDVFFAQFSVDPAGFRYADHAGAEGLDLLGALNPFGRKPPPPKPVTLAMLVEAAAAGRWPDA